MRSLTEYNTHPLRQYMDRRGSRDDGSGIFSEGSAIAYRQDRRFNLSLGSARDYIQQHPLDAGWKLGLVPGATAGAYMTVIPYTLTATSALANTGLIGLGALTGGLFGLGIAGAMLYGWFRGRRRYANGKQNPQYDPKVPRSLGKWFLDWIEERNIEAEQSIPRGRG